MEDKISLSIVISLKLHDLLEKQNILPVKTDLNKNDPTKTVWFYNTDETFLNIRKAYIEDSHKRHGIV